MITHTLLVVVTAVEAAVEAAYCLYRKGLILGNAA